MLENPPSKTLGAPGDRLEHRLHVRRRACDDFEDVSCGRLSFERVLCLIEQARILDGDDSLVGEGRDKLYLTFSKGDRLTSGKGKSSDGFAAPHQGNAEHGPDIAYAGFVLLLIFGIAPRISNHNRPFQESDPTYQCSPTSSNLSFLFMLPVTRIDVHLACGIAIYVTFATKYLSSSRVTKANRC